MDTKTHYRDRNIAGSRVKSKIRLATASGEAIILFFGGFGILTGRKSNFKDWRATPTPKNALSFGTIAVMPPIIHWKSVTEWSRYVIYCSVEAKTSGLSPQHCEKTLRAYLCLSRNFSVQCIYKIDILHNFIHSYLNRQQFLFKRFEMLY